MFIDRVTIDVEAGKGGDGCASFRREKFVARGGPDGGRGGRGGDVVLVGNRNAHTLLDFRWRRIFKAGRGGHGAGNNMTGASSDHLVLDVPLGTVILDAVTLEPLGEVLADDQRVIVATGGKGGKGNLSFRSSTDRAPMRKEPGGEGEKRSLRLELKLIADVGIVGLPNAGKSSLLAKLSRATPKIGDYPFTTTQPNLGLVAYGDYQSFVMADIPGLIEGAHEGKGMGLDFLRHIERTRVLLYLLDGNLDGVEKQYAILREELGLYNKKLLEKPKIIAINKMDLLQKPVEATTESIDNEKIYNISAVTGEGLDSLMAGLTDLVRQAVAS